MATANLNLLKKSQNPSCIFL